MYVKGHWVEFSREEIDRLFNLRVQKDSSKFKKQLKELEHQKIVDLLTARKGKWNGTRKTVAPFFRSDSIGGSQPDRGCFETTLSVVTPEPDPTRLADPNRNLGVPRLILFIYLFY